MDTTGYTSEELQLAWLRQLLGEFPEASPVLVFSNRSFLETPAVTSPQLKLPAAETKQNVSRSFLQEVQNIIVEKGVLAAISSSYKSSQITQVGPTLFVASGGAGGLINEDDLLATYYATEVKVRAGHVTAKNIYPNMSGYSPSTTLFSWLGNKVLSWLYISFLDISLVASVLFTIVYILYQRLIMRIDYYPATNENPPPTKPLRIAMFTNNYLPFIGGVPLSIERLKTGLEAQGHSVYVFAPEFKGSPPVQQQGVIRCSPLFHYRRGKLIMPVSNIFSSKIRREFGRLNPDIVHVHHPFWLGSVGKRLASRYRKPVVFTYHTRFEQYNHYLPFFHSLGGGEIPHMLIKYFAAGCDAVIAPSSSAKRYLRNLGIGKLITVQPTGIVLQEKKLPCPDVMLSKKGLRLFSVFRLSEEKNPYFLLEGLKILASSSQQAFCCYIAGSGPEEGNMRKWVAENDLEDHIVLLGSLEPSSIAAYYQAADIFVFSSESETQGMVILEAIAAASPVVALNSSGINDIVTDGVNGFKTKADLEVWTSKVRLLLEDATLRQQLAMSARQTAAEYSMENMCRNILQMYYEIIEWKKQHPDKVFIR